MKRDAIFYDIFQRFPGLLFAIVDKLPDSTQGYRFESVEVKEPNFRIDGVFLPLHDSIDKIVYFSEFQFQSDEKLYHRFFCESFQYMYRNYGLYKDWYGVIIFPSKSMDPKDKTIYEDLLNSKRVKRIYLNEIGDPTEQSIEINLLQLTATSRTQMVTQVKQLMERVKQEDTSSLDKDEIIEVITKIAIARFADLSREEVEAMLDVAFKESRIYKELREEIEHDANLKAERQANLKVARAIRALIDKGFTLQEAAGVVGVSEDEARELIEKGEV